MKVRERKRPRPAHKTVQQLKKLAEQTWQPTWLWSPEPMFKWEGTDFTKLSSARHESYTHSHVHTRQMLSNFQLKKNLHSHIYKHSSSILVLSLQKIEVKPGRVLYAWLPAVRERGTKILGSRPSWTAWQTSEDLVTKPQWLCLWPRGRELA